jgi:hypothetical protein
MIHKKLILFGVLIAAILAIGINFTLVNSQQNKLTPPPFPTSKLNNVANVPTSTRPPQCVPLPNLNSNNIGKPSSTPTFAPVGSSNKIAVETPQIYSPATEKIIDLSPNLANADKAVVRVFRCDGTIVLYYIDPAEDINTKVTIAAGDTIISYAPPSSVMGHEPPKPISPSATAQRLNSTSLPYPPPTTVTPTNTPTRYPYP